MIREIIPAIIPQSYAELEEKVKLVAAQVKTVQLDIMDGVLVNNKTWSSPEDLKNIKADIFFEAHIMAAEPGKILNRWLKSPKVSRVILHWESDGVEDNLISLAGETRTRGKKFGLALNPATPLAVLDNCFGELDLILLMGVEPGFAGQVMKPAVIAKIMALRQRCPKLNIEVDGGVKLENMLKLIRAGANFLVMGSAIFAAPDPQAVIRQAYKIIGEKSGLA